MSAPLGSRFPPLDRESEYTLAEGTCLPPGLPPVSQGPIRVQTSREQSRQASDDTPNGGTQKDQRHPTCSSPPNPQPAKV